MRRVRMAGLQSAAVAENWSAWKCFSWTMTRQVLVVYPRGAEKNTALDEAAVEVVGGRWR